MVASSRSAEACGSTAAEIRYLGRRTLAHSVDVGSRASVKEMAQGVTAEFDHVDILVNCAGITRRIPTLECSEELWENIFDVNLNGTCGPARCLVGA